MMHHVYVLVHDEFGIFLGIIGGVYAGWSKYDAYPTAAVSTFDSEAEATHFLSHWDDVVRQHCTVRPVLAFHPMRLATLSDLRAAGLESAMGNMTSLYLQCAEPMGRA